jgi:hypothetical protein
MRSQKAGLVGVAAVGVERYLRWEIAGDVLRLRERETVVDMRLGGAHHPAVRVVASSVPFTLSVCL